MRKYGVIKPNSYWKGLQSLWLPDGSQGPLVDIGPRKFSGIRTNVTQVMTQRGLAGDYNGSSAYYDCGDVYGDALAHTPFTEMSVFSADTNHQGALIGKTTSTNNRQSFMYVNTGPTIRYSMFTTGQNKRFDGPSISLNTWYCSVFSYDGSNDLNGAIMCLNGLKTGSIGVNDSHTAGALIGGNYVLGSRRLDGTPSFYFNGKIAMGARWNRALSLNDCQKISADPTILLKRSSMGWMGLAAAAAGGDPAAWARLSKYLQRRLIIY